MDKYEAGQIATDRALLRFITCGSVDNGKSTLIGRLLFESGAIYDDEIYAARNAGSDNKATNSNLEFAHLLDGLEAERSQGITIDVAYRFFSSERRRFIVADTPGHEEYIRNMATAASTADLAIILVDAKKGRTIQTDRHAYIASMLGVRHALIAINKIDAVGYSEAVFDHIRLEYLDFFNSCNFSSVRYIPLSARFGDNITTKSPRTPWYQGLPLLGALDATSSAENRGLQSLRLPVQIVLREDSFRGYAGNVASGHLKVGELVIVARTGRSSLVQQIFALDEPASEVETGEPVTIVLEDDLDVSRGDILVGPQDRPHVANRLKARVIWFDRNPLLPGRTYILKTENNYLNAVATSIDFEVDMSTRQQSVVKSLSANTVGLCNFTLQNAIAFDAYNDNRATGNFIILDRATKVTLGAGMIEHPLREASNIHPQPTDLTKQARSATKSQSPAVVWLTGLSGAGKSTIANIVESKLHACGKHTYVLDSDNLRHGLNQDLGFSSEDRTENIRRLAEVAKLMVDAGLIVVVASISPLHAQRQFARDLMLPGEFIEVFVDTPIEECVQRDPKGLYQKALAGKIENFTGISSAYERPENPEIHVRTPQQSADEIALLIVEALTVGHAGTR